jgi:hypothetical protein
MNRACFLVLAAVCLSASFVAAQQEAADRQVKRVAGKHVRESIRPGDKSVQLIDASDDPLLVQPAPDMSLTKWLFGGVDGVVLAKVDRRQGKLTTAGDWVQSDVSATIVEVFKAPKGTNWAPSQRIAFEEEGGEIQVNGVRVNAVVPRARGVKAGQTYLMLLVVDPDGGRIVVGPDTMYELKEGRFTKLSSPANRLHDLDKIEADLSDHVLSEFRELGRRN